MATVISSSKEGILSVTGPSTFPPPSSIATGTITVAANSTLITGSGTNFSKFQPGDWIMDETNFECHKIVDIPTTKTSSASGTVTTKSDLYCTVDMPFQNALSGATLVIVPASHIASASIDCTTAGKYNNVALDPAKTYLLPVRMTNGETLPIDPIFIDGTG